MKKYCMIALVLACASASSFAQQKVFDWVTDSDELVRLTPGSRQKTHLYNSMQGGAIKLDLRSQQPVTIAVVQRTEWDNATQDPNAIYQPQVMDRLQYFCVQQHVVSSTYSCNLPISTDSMALIIRDERELDHRVLSEAGEAMRMARAVYDDEFAAPNEVHVQYYRWSCVQNCFPPEFRGIRLSKEKYQLSNVMKSYSLPLPEHAGEQVEVKLKSPVPMVVAVVPSATAEQLYSKPDMLEAALGQGTCQERGVQSMNFACKLNADSVAQSLIVVPEPAAGIPSKAKAQIEVTSVKCVANCKPLGSN